MIGFSVFLIGVFILGYIYLSFESVFNKRKITIPQVSEVSMQFAGDWGAEEINLPKSAPRINQAHWQIRTFERPRRKVKR